MNASLKWPWLRALRPAQWIKNGIVPAAYFFAKWDPSQSSHVQGARPLLFEAAAVACFCGGYLMVALMLATTVLGALGVATSWAGDAAASGGFLAGGIAASLANFLLTCGMLVSSVCAGFMSGFGARSAQKLVVASLSIGFVLLFFVGKGMLKAMLGLPMQWFMLKKNGNEQAAAPAA